MGVHGDGPLKRRREGDGFVRHGAVLRPDAGVISHARGYRPGAVGLVGQTRNLDATLLILERLRDAARGDLRGWAERVWTSANARVRDAFLRANRGGNQILEFRIGDDASREGCMPA